MSEADHHGKPRKPAPKSKQRFGRPPGSGPVARRPGAFDEQTRRESPVGRAERPSAGWDAVASWYDKLVGDEGSDYHQQVILPAALRMMDPQPGERFLDLCCGQGVFARKLAEAGAGFVLGVDASPRLIAAAKTRGPTRQAGHKSAADESGIVRYAVGDARKLGGLADGGFDGVACIMAVQDLEGVDEVFREMSRALRPGGRSVILMMHPCFRIPRQSGWGWDYEKKVQFRRVDRYAGKLSIPIATHPGRDPRQQTFFYHLPLADYINALGAAGLPIVACEELLTHRESAPGGRSRGENRSAQEIPVFLALTCVKPASSPAGV